MREGMMETTQDYAKTATQSVQDTAMRIPSDVYLFGALGSIVISLAFKLSGRDRDAEFVGHWAPTFLALGLFSKLIEHDRKQPRRAASR